MKKGYKFLIVLVLLAVAGGLFYKYCVKISLIDASEIGVKADIGNPISKDGNYEVEAIRGYVTYMPAYTDLSIYPTTVQTVNLDSMKVVSADGVEFTIAPTVSYMLDPAKAVQYYKTYRKPFSELNGSYLKEMVKASYTAGANSFRSDSLINNIQQLETAAGNVLSGKLSDLGLVLKNMNVNLRVPQSIKDIVNLRSLALQNAILAEDKKKQAEAEVQIDIVKADAVRKEDSLKYSALTPLAIQKMFIEKWDGKLPVYGDTPKIYKNITDQ